MKMNVTSPPSKLSPFSPGSSSNTRITSRASPNNPKSHQEQRSPATTSASHSQLPLAHLRPFIALQLLYRGRELTELLSYIDLTNVDRLEFQKLCRKLHNAGENEDLAALLSPSSSPRPSQTQSMDSSVEDLKKMSPALTLVGGLILDLVSVYMGFCCDILTQICVQAPKMQSTALSLSDVVLASGGSSVEQQHLQGGTGTGTFKTATTTKNPTTSSSAPTTGGLLVVDPSKGVTATGENEKTIVLDVSEVTTDLFHALSGNEVLEFLGEVNIFLAKLACAKSCPGIFTLDHEDLFISDHQGGNGILDLFGFGRDANHLQQGVAEELHGQLAASMIKDSDRNDVNATSRNARGRVSKNKTNAMGTHNIDDFFDEEACCSPRAHMSQHITKIGQNSRTTRPHRTRHILQHSTAAASSSSSNRASTSSSSISSAGNNSKDHATSKNNASQHSTSRSPHDHHSSRNRSSRTLDRRISTFKAKLQKLIDNPPKLWRRKHPVLTLYSTKSQLSKAADVLAHAVRILEVCVEVIDKSTSSTPTSSPKSASSKMIVEEIAEDDLGQPLRSREAAVTMPSVFPSSSSGGNARRRSVFCGLGPAPSPTAVAAQGPSRGGPSALPRTHSCASSIQSVHGGGPGREHQSDSLSLENLFWDQVAPGGRSNGGYSMRTNCSSIFGRKRTSVDRILQKRVDILQAAQSQGEQVQEQQMQNNPNVVAKRTGVTSFSSSLAPIHLRLTLLRDFVQCKVRDLERRERLVKLRITGLLKTAATSEKWNVFFSTAKSASGAVNSLLQRAVNGKRRSEADLLRSSCLCYYVLDNYSKASTEGQGAEHVAPEQGQSSSFEGHGAAASARQYWVESLLQWGADPPQEKRIL
ncbi:unnamed protein product [Amoebophrya sp. A25]|nr:unnamed protein product [Amoebophrya sp. A25]|eukprot:GSA25T00010288001.1